MQNLRKHYSHTSIHLLSASAQLSIPQSAGSLIFLYQLAQRITSIVYLSWKKETSIRWVLLFLNQLGSSIILSSGFFICNGWLLLSLCQLASCTSITWLLASLSQLAPIISLYHLTSSIPLYHLASIIPLYHLASSIPLYHLASSIPLYHLASIVSLYINWLLVSLYIIWLLEYPSI